MAASPMLSARASPFSFDLPVMITEAPSCANNSAVAAPMHTRTSGNDRNLAVQSTSHVVSLELIERVYSLGTLIVAVPRKRVFRWPHS